MIEVAMVGFALGLVFGVTFGLGYLAGRRRARS